MPPHRLATLVYALASALLVAWCGQRTFARQGDGWEYLAVLEAFSQHGSPDVRPSDIEALFGSIDAQYPSLPPGLARGLFAEELPHRFVTASDGRTYAVHFWLYPLLAYPARLALQLLHEPRFNALVVTNAWMAAAAVAVVLACGAGSRTRRLMFAAMVAVSPVVWYITFTGVEVFCWSLALVALVCLERQHYAASALAAGLAATQNPPLVLLAAVPVVLAARRGPWTKTLPVLAGATAAAIPVVYSMWLFGLPSLVLARHADVSLISIGRTASLLFDLNVGLLPYVPVLLVALPVALWRLRTTRNLRASLVAIAVTGLLLVVQVQINWNSDGRGLHRYLLWMLPSMVWLVLEVWQRRTRPWLVGASVCVSGAILVLTTPGETNWLEQGPLARWVLQRAPSLYNPDFELFAERSSHQEEPPAWILEGRRRGWMAALPVAHGYPSGEVTKLLVQRDSAARLPTRFRVDPVYLPRLMEVATASVEPQYVHPPPGAVWAAPGSVDGVFVTPAPSTAAR
jgi:hypothetical protein